MGTAARLQATLTSRPLSGNGVILLTALYGLVGWAQTTYTVHLVYPLEVGRDTPSGTDVSFATVGPWIEVVTQYTSPLMDLWFVLTGLLLVVLALFAERGAVLSLPSIVWGVGIVAALGLTAYANDAQVAHLVWLPWLVLYAVAYLVTGLVVERGGVYHAAGAVSALLTLYGLFALFTGTGTLVLTSDPGFETPLAGAVLIPFPYVYAVLGALHVVPMAVDGLRGGRQMTPQGVPAVRTSGDGGDGSDGEDDAGGVVEV